MLSLTTFPEYPDFFETFVAQVSRRVSGVWVSPGIFEELQDMLSLKTFLKNKNFPKNENFPKNIWIFFL